MEPVSVSIELACKVVSLAQSAWELTQIAKEKGKKCDRAASQMQAVRQIISRWDLMNDIGIVAGVSRDAVELLLNALEDINLSVQALITDEVDWRGSVVVFLSGRKLSDALRQAEDDLDRAITLFGVHQNYHILQNVSTVENLVRHVLTLPLLSSTDTTLPLELNLQYADIHCSFQAKDLLGEGGCSDVFQGNWKGINVAVKRIKIPTRDIKRLNQINRQMEAEVKLLHQCSIHRNILQIHGYCQSSDCESNVGPLMIIELMGLTLCDAIQQSKLPLFQHRQDLMQGIAAAVEFLHLRGIVHRDIKSSNVLLDNNMNVAKLSDFGEAKVKPLLCPTKHTTTLNTKLCPSGTIQYMSPEVLRGEVKGSSRAADVYAFGVTLWECVTSQIPHQADDDQLEVSAIVLLKAISHDQMLIVPTSCDRKLSKSEHQSWETLCNLTRLCIQNEPRKRPLAVDVVHHLMATPQLESSLISTHSSQNSSATSTQNSQLVATDKSCPYWKNSKFIAVVITCMVLAVGVLIAMLFHPKQTHENLPQSPEEGHWAQCHAQCQDITGIPVHSNGLNLKKAIKDYLHDPESSPYGSVINCWDVSQVKDMSFAFSTFHEQSAFYDEEFHDEMFYSFNEALDCWNTSQVTKMIAMFHGAEQFNHYIGNWDVSHVITMDRMFAYAKKFNQDIGGWHVSSVSDMNAMFDHALSFNHDLSTWNVSNVDNMWAMFLAAENFNSLIDKWDVSKVQNMASMFENAHSFNQYIGDWNVSNVATMGNMFAFASEFNQDISSWDVSNVNYMKGMFSLASSFNQDVSHWNVSAVANMNSMFCGAIEFNQDLCPWKDHIVGTSEVDTVDIFTNSGCDDVNSPSLYSWCQICQD